MRGISSGRGGLRQAIYAAPRVSVTGAEGTTVRIQGAYGLHADGRLRIEDNRSAQVTDRLILAGPDRVEWEPRFRGQGLRYLELTADREVELQDEMQRESREHTTVSNVMKVRHDSAKAAINNIR